MATGRARGLRTDGRFESAAGAGPARPSTSTTWPNQSAGVERRVSCYAPSFLLALMTVAQTDLYLAAPRELVVDLLGDLGLAAVEPPLPLQPVRVALHWHEGLHGDAGHRWLRELLRAVLKERLTRGGEEGGAASNQEVLARLRGGP